MKRQKTYQSFISDDIDLIKEQFSVNGYTIDKEDDFSTYDGWKEKNRKVKRGEKATIVVGSKPYPQPLWRYGAPILNAKGKQEFGKFPPKFALFHKEQTECLT